MDHYDRPPSKNVSQFSIWVIPCRGLIALSSSDENSRYATRPINANAATVSVALTTAAAMFLVDFI